MKGLILTAESIHPKLTIITLLIACLISFSPDAVSQQGPAITFTLTEAEPVVHSSLMVAGNVDNDSFPDVLTEFDYGTVSLALGNGDGSLRPPTTWNVCADCRGVNFGDLDEDGNNEVVVNDMPSNVMKIMWGNGDGTFSHITSLPCPRCRRWVTVEDVDRDGHLDLLSSSLSNSILVFYRGHGNGSFSPVVHIPVGVTPRTNTLADLNNDCLPDLVVPGWNSGDVAILLGTGPGTFGVPILYPLPAKTADATVGDFNTDGCLDLVAASYDQYVLRHWEGDCSGGFIPVADYPVSYHAHDIAVADFNCDGLDDFVVVERSRNSLTVFTNVGGSFQVTSQGNAGGDPFTLSVADFDLDGRLDLACLDRTPSPSYMRIFLNQTPTGACTIPPRDYMCMPPPDLDSDDDGLEDDDEVNIYGTDPFNPDTDGDWLDDYDEIFVHGTDPVDYDTDGDGLGDLDEITLYFTDATNWDTDGDYLPDGYETSNFGRTPPLNPFDPTDGDTNFESCRSDGNPNYHEYWNGSDPWTKDPFPRRFVNPACFFWGEADGDGINQANDAAILGNAIAGLGASYDRVYPDDGGSQDLDDDGLLQASDMNILRNFINRTSVGSVPSRPASLTKAYEPGVSIEVGGTCHVTALVTNEVAGSQVGFAVIFEVDPASTGSAVILGGDGETDAGNRFDVSNRQGLSTIYMKVTSPGNIIVNAKIPECGSPGTGRWSPEILLSPPFTVTAVP